MEQNNDDVIREAFSAFLTNELLNPTVDKYLESRFDAEYIHRLSEPMAELLSEYYPEYYAEDYKSQIGKYFFASLYGDALTEDHLFNKLSEFKDDETDVNVRGINLRFTESFSALKTSFELESLRESRFLVHDTDEIVELIILKLLNEGKITLEEG